ncbi:MAG: DUF3553 domain-containing protein [Phycisphaerales bacterium]|nr:DUF3553 domain-containing protein [Phycisphaerales bacterium]
MSGTQIKSGMLVVHPNKPEWGPGKVAKVDREYVWVFWRDANGGEVKKIARSVITLETAPDQSDPILDNLPPLLDSMGAPVGLPRRQTLPQAVARFLGRFPGGFHDPAYLGDMHSGERAYKEAAHRECVERFGGGRYARLLAENRAQLVEEVKRTYRSVNLIAVFEKAALTDALESIEAALPFLECLGRVIATETVSEETFVPYLKSVCDLPTPRGRVATWPIATVIPFLMQPDRHLFLKPSVTEVAADVLGFNLNYDPTPNWLTYSRLLEMGRVYFNGLRELRPRDMIDVQSFFWVACGGYDRN